MCIAFTRVNALFIVYHSHATDDRGHWGNRPHPEETLLISLPENGLLGSWHAIGRYAHYQHDSNDPHSLSSGGVLSLYLDRSGVLWIGTSFGGISKLIPDAGRLRTIPCYR